MFAYRTIFRSAHLYVVFIFIGIRNHIANVNLIYIYIITLSRIYFCYRDYIFIRIAILIKVYLQGLSYSILVILYTSLYLHNKK